MNAATDATTSPGTLPRHEDLVEERLVLWYFVAALTFMFVSMLAGLLMGLQLLRHNPLPAVEYFSPGRWRMIHTNAIAYGFLANAFLGIMHWVIPRLTVRPVLSRPMSYFIFAAWQIVVLSTAVGLMLGQARGLEWGETPVWIDPVALLGLLLVAINFGAPIFAGAGADVQRCGITWRRLWSGRSSRMRWGTSCRNILCVVRRRSGGRFVHP
ncbi:MAG: cbb3-type cytochrome c oxidase subunit I [Planctomycetaceae bacterium]